MTSDQGANKRAQIKAPLSHAGKSTLRDSHHADSMCCLLWHLLTMRVDFVHLTSSLYYFNVILDTRNRVGKGMRK